MSSYLSTTCVVHILCSHDCLIDVYIIIVHGKLFDVVDYHQSKKFAAVISGNSSANLPLTITRISFFFSQNKVILCSNCSENLLILKKTKDTFCP